MVPARLLGNNGNPDQLILFGCSTEIFSHWRNGPPRDRLVATLENLIASQGNLIATQDGLIANQEEMIYADDEECDVDGKEGVQVASLPLSSEHRAHASAALPLGDDEDVEMLDIGNVPPPLVTTERNRCTIL